MALRLFPSLCCALASLFLTATVLALESIGPGGDVAEQAIMVSCDLIATWKTTQESVKKLVKKRLPDFDSDKLFLNATHTHQGPQQESGTFKNKFDLIAPKFLHFVRIYQEIIVARICGAGGDHGHHHRDLGLHQVGARLRSGCGHVLDGKNGVCWGGSALHIPAYAYFCR